MKKLKVLYIIDTLEGYGAEKSLVELARNFKKIVPVFVHIYQGDMLKAKLEASGIKTYSLDISKKYAFKRAVETLAPIYQKEKPDVIHATLFRSEIIARKLKKRFPEICLIGSFVSNAYSSDRYANKNLFQKLKLRYFHRIDRQTVEFVDCFVSNSKAIKDITREALGIPVEKVQVIYRGRNSSEFGASNCTTSPIFLNDNNKIKLLNVSRLIPLKGQMDILKALPEIINYHPEIKLFLAGHGSYRQELEEQVKKYSLQAHVEFLGRIENISGLLQDSAIFLYPSYSEGLPGALIEAMMAEKIIICSDIPVNRECVSEETALIFRKGDVEDLKSKIIKVLQNPWKYEHLGKAARKIAIEKFELSVIVNSYERFYMKIQSEKKRQKVIRVLHLIQKQQKRGAEIFTFQMARHQKDLGMKVQIASIFEGGSKFAWNGNVVNLEGQENSRFVDFKAWKKLYELVKKFQPDIIQANAGDTLKYAVFSKKIFRWKAPIVFRNASEVGRYLNSNFHKRFNHFLFSNIQGVASVSKASENDLLDHFPHLKGSTCIIPVGLEENDNIIPVKLFSISNKHIVHVGGFTFEKNHTGLIRIFTKTLEKKKDIQLHLVGDGPLRPEIEEMVKELDLNAVVHFHGSVHNPLAYMKAADILILPSIIEGLPGVILEAMYCKTPVIAYDIGGISEILNEETGTIIKKGEEENFSAAIIDVLEFPDARKVENAFQLVSSRYLNRELAKRFKDYYLQIS